ncbi:hypothetical protein [Nitratireductor sp. XY-223]|uniref:hypothetical protein n=1 Tax=Nitratireductor sp. XY-223 TaxID=2561926 RepID=UPI00145B6CE1|nr:hypothetical protein [Nitratireductor sp. XY-223]
MSYRERTARLVGARQNPEHAPEELELHETGEGGDKDAEDHEERDQRLSPCQKFDKAEKVLQCLHIPSLWLWSSRIPG